MVGEELEQGPYAIRVPAQEHLPVGRVQEDEGEHPVQHGSHLLNAKLLVQVEQHLAVHLGLEVKAKLFLQLKKEERLLAEATIIRRLCSHKKKKDKNTNVLRLQY